MTNTPSVALVQCRQADRLSAGRWDGFARFIKDVRLCLGNNAAERALRGFALGRKSWLFAGSERRAAMTTLIMTARLADIPQTRLPELLPWKWKAPSQ